MESTLPEAASSSDPDPSDMLAALSLSSRRRPLPERFSIAPMVDVSDRFFRYFMRLLLSPRVPLYTEMLNEHAVLFAKQGREALLKYSPNQHPLVLQLGGNDP